MFEEFDLAGSKFCHQFLDQYAVEQCFFLVRRRAGVVAALGDLRVVATPLELPSSVFEMPVKAAAGVSHEIGAAIGVELVQSFPEGEVAFS